MNKAIPLITALGLVIGMSGVAQADLVVNGSFSSTKGGTQINNVLGNGQLGFNTTVDGWTNAMVVDNGQSFNAYNLVFAPRTPGSTAPGALTTADDYQHGLTTDTGPDFELWGPRNGGLDPLLTSPDGGNFLALDGAYHTGAISQTISGLTVGNHYDVSFYWADAQQFRFNGTTTDQLQVTFGNQTISTAIVPDIEHGVTPWIKETFNFTASSDSQLLSFLSHGTPAGVPPFALLDGVSVNASATPEGSSLGLFSMGLLSMGGVGVYARRKKAAKSVS